MAARKNLPRWGSPQHVGLIAQQAVGVPLKALRNQLGKQFRAGVVLYLGDQIAPFGDKLWLVPVPALWAP